MNALLARLVGALRRLLCRGSRMPQDRAEAPSGWDCVPAGTDQERGVDPDCCPYSGQTYGDEL